MEDMDWWDATLSDFDSGQMWADDLLFGNPDPGATPYNVAVDYGGAGANLMYAGDASLPGANLMFADEAGPDTPSAPPTVSMPPGANLMFAGDEGAEAAPAPAPGAPYQNNNPVFRRVLSALDTPGGIAALLAGAGMLAEGPRGGGNGAATGAGLFKGTVPKYRATRTEMPNRPSNADIRNYATANIGDPRTIANAMHRFGLSEADMGRAAPEIPQADIENYFRSAGIQRAGRRPGEAPLRYFSGVNYEPLAAGGLVGLAQQQAQPFPMQSNGFVLPADVVSALGNGSSRAGAERVQGMLGGGRVIDGPGDGQSDSIPAHIDGRQPAAVARDEVYLSPQEVARIGGGDTNQGVAALHKLMDNVRQQAYGHTRQQRPVDPRKIV